MTILELLEGWYNTGPRHSASGNLSPNGFEGRAEATAKPPAGNGRHRDQIDLDPSRILGPEIQTYRPGVPQTPAFDRSFLPPAIAHLGEGGDNPQPSTETG